MIRRASLTLLLAIGLAGCGSDPAPSTPTPVPEPRQPAVANQPDIVLALVAGLRADRPGLPGAEAAFLEALAPSSGLRFTNAYAQSSSASMSLGSVLTGLYPAAIPLCSAEADSSLAGGAQPAAWCATLPPDRYTLPEVLGLYGYRTALFAGGLPQATLLAGEFQHAVVQGSEPEQRRRGSQLASELSQWWDAGGDAPRLAVVVLPQPGWRPDDPRLEGLSKDDLRDVSSEDRQAAELAYTAAGKRLGAQLRETLRGLGSDTGPRQRLVVVSSLHGLSLLEPEGFNDEAVDPFDHNVLVDRTTHVPLVLTGSAAPEGFTELHQVVELADLLPTLATLAGATPPAGLHGEDLLDLEGAQDPLAWAYGELGDMLMVRRGDHMLLFRTFLHDRSSLDPELDALLAESTPGQEPFWTLHDVLLDPGQQRDLVHLRPPELAQLRGVMLAVRQGPGAVPSEFLDPEKVWELRMTRIQSYW